MAVSLLFLYGVAVFLAGLVGGWLPRRLHMTHTRTQLTMSFVAGLMLGVAFFHLIPHSALAPSADVDFTMLWVVVGLVFMLLLLRLFHEEEPRVYEAQPVRFGCTCSEERVKQSLSIYSASDIGHMTTDEGLVEADCQFCGAHYEMDPKTVGFEAEGASD